LEFLDVLDGNIPSLIAVTVIVVGGALINNGYLSRMLKARGKGRTVGELSGRMDEMEKGFVPDLGDVLERMDGKLDSMQERMTEMERRLNYADKSALMGIVHNERIHKMDRLRAFNNYLKLGGNGTVAEYAVNELVIPNRDYWIRVLDESRMKPQCDKYGERIAEINGRLRT